MVLVGLPEAKAVIGGVAKAQLTGTGDALALDASVVSESASATTVDSNGDPGSPFQRIAVGIRTARRLANGYRDYAAHGCTCRARGERREEGAGREGVTRFASNQRAAVEGKRGERAARTRRQKTR